MALWALCGDGVFRIRARVSLKREGAEKGFVWVLNKCSGTSESTSKSPQLKFFGFFSILT